MIGPFAWMRKMVGRADDLAVDDEPNEPMPAPVDACPMGGEHDPVEIRSATKHDGPMLVYCKRCRANLTPKPDDPEVFV